MQSAVTATASRSAPAVPPSRQPQAQRRGGRFQPRLGRRDPDAARDPLTADAELRTDLLERVRKIKAPIVERDIFNFGQPKRSAAKLPDPEIERQAQQRLEAALQERKRSGARKPPPRPAPKARPPDWKYFGVAGDGDLTAQRAFLLDGEEILVAAQGSVFYGRYRIERIDVESLVLSDLEAQQRFTLPLEISK